MEKRAWFEEATSHFGARFVLSLVLAAIAVPAFARTVTVTSCDRATGATVLAISAAEAGDGAKALVAAWSPSDIGNAVTNARETVYVGAVAAAETEKSFTIPSAWRAKAGFVRFFLMADVPPYDTRLESLRVPSAGAYIDTGFVPNKNSDIRVKAYHPGDMAPFGVSGKCYLFSNQPAAANKTSAHYFGFFGVSGTTSVAPRDLFPHEYQINAKGAYVDGICRMPFDPSALAGTTTSTLTLFARKNDGNTTVGKQGECTIYWAQLRQNGTLEHDYVPCVKDGVATLYDRAKGTFCTVKGNGAFTVGAEIGPDAQDCGGVESATDALALGPALAIDSVDVGLAEVTVAFTGAHDEGVLYAVADTADRGTSVSAWANIHFLGKVAADATTATFAIPGTWIANGYQMRFLWRSAADFPYDREVEWLYSASQAWVNTTVIPTQYTKVSVCGKSAWNVCLFGLTSYFYFFPNVDSKYYYAFFGIQDNFTAGGYDPATAFRTYTLGPEGVEIDGTRLVDFSGRATTYTKMDYACPIFYRRAYDGGSLSKTGTAWVKWAKVWEDGELVRDFVPCVSNGVAGLYDRVHREFRTSQTSATFEPGETVAAVADEEVVAWSAAFSPASLAGATWDGGGADTSFATAANWEGDVLPDLASGTTMLTFATGGTAAQVPASGAAAGGILFDTANNFALTAASGGTLSIGAGGLTLANRAVQSGATWRMHDLNLPVVVAADQTWDMSTVGNGGSGQRLRVQGNIQGAAGRTLTITGKGCLSLYATNDFAGTVELAGGVTKTFSRLRPFGSAAEGGEIVIDQAKKGRLEMWACVIDKPIRLTSSSLVNDNYFAAYGHCAITAPIHQTGTDPFRIRNEGNGLYGDGILTLSGGGTFAGPVEFGPTNTTLRTVVVEGAPIIQPTLGVRERAFKFHGKTELHLKCPNNRMYIELGASQKGSGSSLHCWTNDVLNFQCDIILGYGSTMDLHGFDQQVGDLQTGSAGHLRSDAPATILAYYEGDITWGANSGVDGAVTFRKSGPKPLTINGTNTTTGALVAFAGPLVLGETACWQGTNVCIGLEMSNRHPSLRLTRSNSFANPTKTVLTMTTTTGSLGFFTDCGTSREPELILDAGVNAVFKDVILNGRHLAPGTWGGPDSPAQNKDGTHFSGSGVITVIGGGMMVIFR